MRLSYNANRKKTGIQLWSVQVLLALIFLLAGVMKLVAPIEMLQGPVALPEPFLRFIGVCETLGALGLLLPGLFHTRPELTPLAAAGLAIIMVGATGITIVGGAIAPALIPVVVGLLATTVAYGRWRLVPLRAS
jgi:uncharacterized membrane protein YphA (DoxX/SURF4 family)